MKCAKKNPFFKFILSNAGTSLINVIIASGLMGGMAMLVAKLATTQGKISKRAFQDQTISQVLSEITTYLAAKETCKKSIAGVNISGDSSNELTIYNKSGPRYDAPSKIDHVKITSIVAKKIDGATLLGQVSPFNVAVTFLRTGKNQSPVPKYIKVVGSIQSDGTVVDCETVDSTESVKMRLKICTEDLGGTIVAGTCRLSGAGLGTAVKKASCEALNGSFNTTTGKCNNVDITGTFTGDFSGTGLGSPCSVNGSTTGGLTIQQGSTDCDSSWKRIKITCSNGVVTAATLTSGTTETCHD
ncbi:MAG: hypothetical protein ISR65_18010 [Bacteriovoracaceae bacterium]|nr:hypothetical protein [Bacteriovoracaceae bacterium]